MLTVNSKNLGVVSILCLKGRIVGGESDVLREAVVSETAARAVILDLNRVTAIDAGGFGLLLELREYTRAREIDFKLMNPQQTVRKLFEVTRLNTVFEITSATAVSCHSALQQQFQRRDLAVCA